MAELDAHGLADQALLIGLVTRDQARQALGEAEDGSLQAVSRVFLRKGFLTSWQLERLQKNDPTGFFYGGCKILFHIAEGTFARVYRGRRESTGESVAVKVLRRRFTSDAESVQRFLHEAEAGVKLDHPNIVKIYEYGEQDKNYYMIMEYVEGSNLRDFLKLRHRISADQSLPLMLGLAEGLKYSLEKGVTHRDIKATNILISTRGAAKLVDFGLATIEGDEKKMQAAHGVRTVDYSALERTCGSPKGDHRSDIYFLGCVYYQMLTGVPPLPEVEASDKLAKMLKRSFGAIKPLSEHSHAPPAGLSAIIEKMMKMDLKQRYQTMEEVVADLKAYQANPEPAKAARRAAAAAAAAARPTDDDAAFEADGLEEGDADRKTILVVEVQDEIREAFRKSFQKLGYRVLLVGDAERAAERHAELDPDLVVFDADGLGSESVVTFRRMHEQAVEAGPGLAALVILGPRQAHLRERIPPDDRILVLTKPIKMKDVHEALAQLAPAEG
jgi:tRNA A-37 threonylcarbamoyl transferase component Bud32/CheY-like chemotaxis protein